MSMGRGMNTAVIDRSRRRYGDRLQMGEEGLKEAINFAGFTCDNPKMAESAGREQVHQTCDEGIVLVGAYVTEFAKFRKECIRLQMGRNDTEEFQMACSGDD